MILMLAEGPEVAIARGLLANFALRADEGAMALLAALQHDSWRDHRKIALFNPA